LFLYFGLEYLGVKGVLIGLLFSMLLALSLIDLRYKAVPDLLSLPTLIVALLINFSIASLMDALIFAGVFALLKIFISAIKKEEVMGEADIIIAAIIGASAGKILGFSAIYIGAVAALVAFLIKKEKTLPFIPFLSIGLFISFIFHEKISSFLGGYFG
jgi:leader peptidase (prepilin peptidase)/N-methyltransferase